LYPKRDRADEVGWSQVVGQALRFAVPVVLPACGALGVRAAKAERSFSVAYETPFEIRVPMARANCADWALRMTSPSIGIRNLKPSHHSLPAGVLI